MGAYIGDYYRVFKGYTRPLDYGSYGYIVNFYAWLPKIRDHFLEGPHKRCTWLVCLGAPS